MLEDLLIPIGVVFICVGLPVILGMRVCFQLVQGRHKERMAMIANGLNPQALSCVERRPGRYTALRNGIVFIGLSAGLFMGVWLSPLMPTLSVGEPSSFFELNLSLPILTLFFGGLSFILYFILSRRLEKKEREEDVLLS